MKTYLLVGNDPTLIVHDGVIDGLKPKVGAVFAEPTVKGGSAEFKLLTQGGLFAFDKKSLVIEDLIGSPTIVGTDGTTILRPTPATLPFKLGANEWLKFSSGTRVGCMVRLDTQRIS